jgi:hypothetical protein
MLIQSGVAAPPLNRRSFTLRTLPGKHFFLHSNETLFLNMLAIQLSLVI